MKTKYFLSINQNIRYDFETSWKNKEAIARIKINKLLEAAGRRFFSERCVFANRELIARFEKKIQATLALVWGES
ncbi:MAG: hypothetical protein HY807_09600 [Nitrospirae bacterium]|nr:hypothetical protein [Nitrospirota bacterium]